jgi:hypothetical protein
MPCRRPEPTSMMCQPPDSAVGPGDRTGDRPLTPWHPFPTGDGAAVGAAIGEAVMPLAMAGPRCSGGATIAEGTCPNQGTLIPMSEHGSKTWFAAMTSVRPQCAPRQVGGRSDNNPWTPPWIVGAGHAPADGVVVVRSYPADGPVRIVGGRRHRLRRVVAHRSRGDPQHRVTSSGEIGNNKHAGRVEISSGCAPSSAP